MYRSPDFLDDSGLFYWDRSLFLLAIVVTFEVALLSIVIIGDTRLVPGIVLPTCPLSLSGVDIHRSRVVLVDGALVLALLLIVSFVTIIVVGLGAFFLLPASVLPFVDSNSYSNVFV